MMNGHVNIRLEDCPECAKVDGWQGKQGLRFSAQHIRHEAMTDEELDLADMCQWVAETHYPVNGKCVACGDDWDGIEAYPNLHGELQCQTYLNARIEKNFWIMGKVQAIADKWRAIDV
ncbi:hypothetical protein CH298_02740 [Rhodococcoides fascians]|nr:hypothetical protein CH303_02740 [Rhodococcus fascians]OZF23102.1 hypothetical protein CH298_02740 [Rhodococcus fascians]OZF24816.1 hypothetical protein CH297_02740 [Rhodococcus fascians]OZF72411.1 hypothetical protein CH308_02745 [Rhodococcus fascians]OZF73709.1 hypothetical protein CH307_02740 [Rhodococcus fascians]